MINKVEIGSSVLDVGCASGDMGEYLVEHKQCKVTGLDSDDEALTRASSRGCYTRLIKMDFDTADFSELEPSSFDCILMGDVIEHVKDPDGMLREMKKLLSERGEFIISLPNVSHGSVKLKLLNNQFEYTEMGLLDRTHLSFFTLNSIVEFCNSNYLQIRSFNRVMSSIYGTEQKVDRKDFNRNILRMVESDSESWVYQYIFSAAPVDQLSPEVNKSMAQPSDQELKRFKKLKRKYRWKI
jgi:methionine biosynthesis protein MetW